ncbi:MAG: enoyl-CoA hydratase-related protein [Proteobacteria bacterium]|nr:enoyl-CoA hydratase-related protein [Pseudomonadota bacterium]
MQKNHKYPDFDFVDVHLENHVLTLTTNRPDKRNAQSRRLLEDLDAAFAQAAHDVDVRVIVLLGSGEHFSGGHDLGSAEELEDRAQRPLQRGLRGRFEHSRENFVDKTLRWRNLPKPTIAGVQGYCIFAGWMVASSMDIIYAADDAMFLGSNFQYFSVPWDMPARLAKELLYESRFIDASEARKLGLVNRIYPKEQLRAKVSEYARRIAENDPFQLRMIKMAVNQVQDTQGFAAHINAAHLMHIASAEGERDPDYALRVPEGARRPMVEKAFENYSRRSKEEDHGD